MCSIPYRDINNFLRQAQGEVKADLGIDLNKVDKKDASIIKSAQAYPVPFAYPKSAIGWQRNLESTTIKAHIDIQIWSNPIYAPSFK
jgi:hypothetical protein